VRQRSTHMIDLQTHLNWLVHDSYTQGTTGQWGTLHWKRV